MKNPTYILLSFQVKKMANYINHTSWRYVQYCIVQVNCLITSLISPSSWSSFLSVSYVCKKIHLKSILKS